MKQAAVWIILAGLIGASGVAVGAFHAHGLRKFLANNGLSGERVETQMENCGTAVRYQLFHAAALLGLAALAHATAIQSARGAGFAAVAAGLLFTAGTVCFSGGLYVIVFAGPLLHWSIVPLGGLMLILGWAAVAVAGIGLLFARSPAAKD